MTSRNKLPKPSTRADSLFTELYTSMRQDWKRKAQAVRESRRPRWCNLLHFTKSHHGFITL